MNRFQFNDAGFKSFGDFVNDMINEVPKNVNSFFPRTNIFESNDQFEIEMLVPGRKKDDFKIALDKNLLTVSFKANEAEKNDEKKVIKKEFTLRSFSRSFTIDEKINVDSIEAKYDNGVLTLVLPKKEEVKVTPKEISVQ